MHKMGENLTGYTKAMFVYHRIYHQNQEQQKLKECFSFNDWMFLFFKLNWSASAI